ncbi:MAG TPA: hypothetical protein VGL55_06570 [Steroidobacteraceae bacterium]|jgi:hypothetical protein
MFRRTSCSPSNPPKKSRRARKAKPGVVLSESDEFEGFNTRDVLNALHGVCNALDLHGDDSNVDAGGLATAAHVLACILRNRAN